MTMQPSSPKPLSVLFLCTHNSSRSQIAELVMQRKVERTAFGRFRVGSMGSTPGDAVNPMALEVRVQQIASDVPSPRGTSTVERCATH